MAKVEFNPATPLYTTDATAWRIDQMPTILRQFEANGRPSILFVHGRGKEPNKSLRGGTFTQGLAVHKLELGYDANVVMFNWDSAFRGLNLFDREVPLSHTESAAHAFGDLVEVLKAYIAIQPATRRMALLVHSMGSVVLEKCIQSALWRADAAVFSRVLFSQPDCDDVGHSAWMQTLAMKEAVFVTFNEDDHVLRRSTDARPPRTHPLGLGTSEPLARSVKYVDLTLMGPLGQKDDDHEVFGKGAMNGQIFVCRFFAEVLRSSEILLNPDINVESVTREVVYRLRSKIDPAAPCLKIPVLPEY